MHILILIKESDPMETSIRAFLEECDYFQGLQVMNDTSTFGSFTYSMLSAFHDELGKTSTVIFPLITDSIHNQQDLSEASLSRRVVSDALYLRGINNELSTYTSIIPIQAPSTWRNSRSSSLLAIDDTNYHTSALLSAHIENSTILLRTKRNRETIPAFSSSLNPHGLHRFGGLSGVLPLYPNSIDEDAISHLCDFSTTGKPRHLEPTYFSRRDVTRALSLPSLQPFDGLVTTQIKINNAMSTNPMLPPLPLPSSFPNIFADHTILDHEARRRAGGMNGNVGIFSSLSATAGTGTLFADYARFVSKCVEQRRGSALTHGLVDDLDDLRELANDLWTIRDGYDDVEVEEPSTDGGEDDD
ncbi:mtDNA inheritance, partitioning of the mitochondrial organelle [Marasmius sp. AFHP31]|nr:mtDNA inheritance, partitioning of the mitochondrial organelle [Marasmius sp. AFHP31]